MVDLPNYLVNGKIGEGGMATVWLAEHQLLRQPVAIKVLNREYVHNQNVRKRFLAEARSLFGLNHPGIVRVTDLIDQEDNVAMVMEYVDGNTLKEHIIKRGQMDNESIKDLFVQMLDAVGHVHEKGLIHRDIKPSNFMVTKEGRIKLLDFGIAKVTTGADHTGTGTGLQMGTPMYMSPEQIKSTKDVTPKTDIYSLGVVLWQLVTGKKPYQDDTLSTFEIYTKVVNEKLEPTLTCWDEVIGVATNKDELSRYRDTNAFKLAVTNVGNTSKGTDDGTVLVDSKQASKFGDRIYTAQDLLKVNRKGEDGKSRWGFISRSGDVVIPVIFLHLGDFKNGIVEASADYLLFGLLDLQGNWILNPQFDRIFLNGDRIEATIGGKYGLINRKGDWLLAPQFDNLSFPFALAEDKWGIINDDGDWLADPIFDTIDSDTAGELFSVSIGENFGVIDNDAQWIVQPLMNNLQIGDHCIKVLLNGLYGIMDRRGKWTVTPSFDEVYFADDILIVKEKGFWGLLDPSGSWIMEPQFDELASAGGLGTKKRFFASLNEKQGVIDISGRWVLPPSFSNIRSFSPSAFVAESDGKWGIVDSSGAWVCPPRFEVIYEMDAVLGVTVAGVGDNYGIIDHLGKWLVSPSFSLIETFDTAGFAKACLGTKYGFIDKSGKWLIPPEYDIYDMYEEEFAPYATGEDDEDPDAEQTLEQIKSIFTEAIKDGRTYMNNDIPDKKLSYFMSQFDISQVSEWRFFVYYDDTLFGKGDDGYAILVYKDAFHLMCKEYGGEPVMLSITESGTAPKIVGLNMQKKSIVFKIQNRGTHGTWLYKLSISHESSLLALGTFLSMFIDAS